MSASVVVPSPGESITDGVLAAWLKADGDTVAAGEELFEFETDKATLAIPAPADGILKIRVPAGSTIKVGEAVAEILAAQIPSGAPATPSAAKAATATAQPAPPTEKAALPPMAPSVRKLIQEQGLDSSVIRVSGKDGRLTRADVMAHIEAHPQPAISLPPAQPATPPAPPVPAAAVPLPASIVASVRKPMSPIRKRIAENLVRSKQTSAHLTTFNEIDMSRVMELRQLHGDAFEKKHGVRLGFMSFFVKAACQALRDFPAINAFIDGDDILYNSDYNIGVAVSTERGLLVPVLRNADQQSFATLESTIRDFAQRARDKKLGLAELSGGTFTITNGGTFGSLLSTPIPTPPQTAILGIHAVQKRAVVVDDQIVIRPMTYAALTYDHRLIDGREAVTFLVSIKRAVEHPETLLLDL